AVTEIAENLFIVFAEVGGDANLRRRLRELPWRAVHLEALTVSGIVDLGDVAVGDDVRINRGFQQRVDRGRDDVPGTQLRNPVFASSGCEQLAQPCQQLLSL